MSKLYFIVNPKAGNGKAKSIWSMVEQKLTVEGIQYSTYFTEKNGHAKELAQRVVDGSEQKTIHLIVIGGDGTINEVINGISSDVSKVRLGVIPGGSGNDFSRGFKIPRDPADALSYLLKQMKGNTPSFDMGRVELEGGRKHFFINSTGAGFDALISYKANQSKWKALLNRLSLGQLVYVIILLKHLFSYKCSTIELNIDGKKHTFSHTWFVTVSNQPYYGGGMKISPFALFDDGKLNVTVVSQLSKLKLLLVFISVFSGKHIKFKEVHTFLAQQVSIYSQEPIYVHSDGEHIGSTPLQITIHDKPLSILTLEGNT